MDLDLCALVEAAMGDCEPLLGSAHSEIRFVDGASVHARADRTRVRQIIRNLLTNALKYGGPDIEVECRVNSDCAFIEVRDNGAGFQRKLVNVSSNRTSVHTTRKFNPDPLASGWQFPLS